MIPRGAAPILRKKANPMREIYKRYVHERYNDKGILVDYGLEYPDNFNFGYDVVDDIGKTTPTAAPCSGATPPGRSAPSPLRT